MKDVVRDWVKSIYGPYTRKDGRKIVTLYGGRVNGKLIRKTVSYPKWLMEQHLGRELTPDETVDHVNRDFTDNRIENLQVLARADHAAIDRRRVEKVKIICKWCGEVAEKTARYVNNNAKQGKAGPFCGKSCAGKYGAAVQNGHCDKKDQQPECPVENREYYFKDKIKPS